MKKIKNKKGEEGTFYTLIGVILSIILIVGIANVFFKIFVHDKSEETLKDFDELIKEAKQLEEGATTAKLVTINQGTSLIIFAPKEEKPIGLVGDGNFYLFESYNNLKAFFILERPTICAEEATCACVCKNPRVNNDDPKFKNKDFKKERDNLKNKLTKNPDYHMIKLLGFKPDYEFSVTSENNIVCEEIKCRNYQNAPILSVERNDSDDKFLYLNGFAVARTLTKNSVTTIPDFGYQILPKEVLIYAGKTGGKISFCLKEECFDEIREKIKKAEQEICELEEIKKEQEEAFNKLKEFYTNNNQQTLTTEDFKEETYIINDYFNGEIYPVINYTLIKPGGEKNQAFFKETLQLIKKCGEKEVIKKEFVLKDNALKDEKKDFRKDLLGCTLTKTAPSLIINNCYN